MGYQKKLAKVESAGLEIKDRGILTFWINVKYEDGFNQGVGGLCLDEYDKQSQTRVGTAYGCEMIRQLLLFFNVNNLVDAKGQIVYVCGEGTRSLDFTPSGLEHLRVNSNDKTTSSICFNTIRDQFIPKED